MSRTSSAVPEQLLTYGEGSRSIADEVRADAGALGATLEHFRASSREHVPSIPPIPEAMRHLAADSHQVADRTTEVGRAFQRAGGAGGVVTVSNRRLEIALAKERVRGTTGDVQRLLLPYAVPRARQEAVAWRDLVAGRWDRRIARVEGFFARMQARLDRFEARVVHGRRSNQWREAREHLRQTKEAFSRRVSAATSRVEDATARLRSPHGRLARIGRLAGPLGIGLNAATAFAGSPYDGTRGYIDQRVAGVTAVAGVALLVGFAPVVAGAVVVAGGAWMVGNLAVDAWQNRQAIGEAVSNGISTVGNALGSAVSGVGSLLGFGS